MDLGLPEYACRNVPTAAYSDHEVGLKVIEDAIGELLAQFVDLQFACII